MNVTVFSSHNIYTVGCYTDDGKSYTGTVSVTESGITCQNWVSDCPHERQDEVKDPSSFPESNLADAHNYCRNPAFRDKPWCYTMDTGKNWEYCEIPKCPGEYSHLQILKLRLD